MSQTPSDKELVLAAQSGQVHAFTALVERTQSMARAVAFSATGDLDNSEDLAQEALLTAWTRLSDLQEPSKFRPWLAGIVRNTARYWRRHRGRHAPVAHESVELIEQMASAEPSPLERAETRESWRHTRDALRCLPDRYREPLMLFYTLGESHSEVAGALGMSEATARQRVCRARKKLRADLEPLRSTGQSIAARSSAAAAVLVLIQGRQALAAHAAHAGSMAGASSPKLFMALGALGGAATVACIAASLVLLIGTERAQPAPERSSAQPVARAQDIENQALSERPGQAASSAEAPELDSPSRMPAPLGAVFIGSGKVKERNPLSERSRTEFVPLSGEARSESRARLQARTSSSGRIRKHGPAVLHSETEETKPLLKPSLDLGAFHPDLWSDE